MDEISDDLFYDNSKNVEKKKESIFLNEFFALFLMICATFGQNFVIDNQAGRKQSYKFYKFNILIYIVLSLYSSRRYNDK